MTNHDDTNDNTNKETKMNKLMTAATVILSVVMIVITTTLAFSATNGAAAFTLTIISIVLVGCVLAALDWGNSWYEAAMHTKSLMDGLAHRMTTIKENTMTASALYPCPDHGIVPFCQECQDKYVGENVYLGRDPYREEILDIMIEEAEAAQEMHDEHYVGAHHNDLQVGCPDCDAIKTHIPTPPIEDDYPF